ncbi:MAG TPA: nucleotidyltransferase [Clostridiales bacterium]|nr:nucleotidyltransferase [Clostridiales bacterium]
MKTTLVVMAAGMGSRYGGLKQMDSFGPGGESILEYSIYDACLAGFEEVVFIIKKDIEELFKEKIGDKIAKKVQVRYVFQDINDIPEGFKVPENRAKPWGTGHAVYSAREVVKNPFCVINADDFYGREAFQLIHDYLCEQTQPYRYCMVGYILKNTLTEFGHVARGACTMDESDNLKEIVERTKIKVFYDGPKYFNEETSEWVEINPETIVSMNIWGFTPEFFQSLADKFILFLTDKSKNLEMNEFYLPFAVDEMLNSGMAQVKVLKTHELWHGVTYADDKPRVKEAIAKMVLEGRYPENL